MALSDVLELPDWIVSCQDGNCVLRRPKGMHTNGGCQCMKRIASIDRDLARAVRVCFQIATKELRRINELENKAKE